MTTTDPLPRRIRLVRHLPDAFIAEPFEILLLFMSLLSGVVTLLVSPDNAVKRALPPVLLYVWGAMLVAAALVGLTGWGVISRAVSPQRRAYGRQLERLAMVMFFWSSLVWSGALLSVGWRAVPTALLTLAFGLACRVRAYVIRAMIQLHELGRLEAIRLMKHGWGP